MHCASVFEKCYWQARDDSKCERRGRVVDDCPVLAIAKKLLAAVYGPDLQVSTCESSTSLIIRPDPFFGIFRQRAARQAFVFETQSVGERSLSMVGSVDVRCPSQDERKKFLKSERWKEALYCAAGYLRPPSYMTPDRGYSIPLLDFYSTHGGLLPFLCTPYVSHHGFFGYVCAQAAVYLCLEMMLHFGATPHSPATINHILSKLPRAKDYDPQAVVATCKNHVPPGQGNASKRADPGNLRGFYNRPMCGRELEDLFEHGSLGTRGLRINLTSWPDLPTIGVLHLKAMLLSQIPVIAVVDFDTLARALQSKLHYGTGCGHVVTIVGYALERGGSDFKVVFHDGHLGPYRELPFSRFVQAALSPVDEDNLSENSILMYAPLPAKVSPTGYLNLVSEVYPLVESGIECSIRLRRVGSLRSALLAYAPGQSAAIAFDRLEKRIRGKVDEYVWLVESRDESGTYLDLIDTAPTAERWLGVLACGVDTPSEPWIFYPGGSDVRKIALDPMRRAERLAKEIKGVCIKRAVTG